MLFLWLMEVREIAEKRDKNGRFLPGNAGGGRPKIPQEVKEAIRAACPEAVQVLIEIMSNQREKTCNRLEAAKTLLDRGYGKPAQAMNVEVSGNMDVRAQIRSILLGHGDAES